MVNATLACTRKLSEGYVSRAALNGVTIKDEALIRIDLIDNAKTPGKICDGVRPFVLTSMHAVEGLLAIATKNNIDLKRISVFCISGRTLQALNNTGVNVLGVAENSTGLVEVIRRSGYKKLLHLTSNIRLDDWKEQLHQYSVSVENVEVYTKTIIPNDFGKIDGVIFFSPSQVETFLQLNECINPMPVFCIGSTTAQAATAAGYDNVFIATASSERAVMELVFDYFKIK